MDSYYHEKFLQNQPSLANKIKRTAVKGQGPRRSQALFGEPNFYLQPSASGSTKSVAESNQATFVPTKGLAAPLQLSILPGTPRYENQEHGLGATTSVTSSARRFANFDSAAPPSQLDGSLETQLWCRVQEQRARNDQLVLLLAMQRNAACQSLAYQPPSHLLLVPPSKSLRAPVLKERSDRTIEYAWASYNHKVS